MLPIKDDNPHFLTPFTTYLIIVLNFWIWVRFQDAGLGPDLVGSICRMGLIPENFFGGGTAALSLHQAAALPCTIRHLSPILTLFSSMFLHGGWLHLLGNMWFLWIFGNNVEDSMGHFRFLIFYVFCGLVAACLQIYSEPGSSIPMVGASGAIGGVMGAYVVLYPKVRVHLLMVVFVFITTIRVPAFLMLGYWFLMQMLGSMATPVGAGGGVAFWAHIGGFVAGAVLIFFFRDRRLVDRHPYHGWSQRRIQEPVIVRSRLRQRQ